MTDAPTTAAATPAPTADADPPLVRRLPADPTADALLDGFFDFVTDMGISLYPAQEEAILEILEGNNVIVNTPTGSGKSLVGVAAHYAALAAGKRSWYTAPIKALVSEKFFALCRDFGTERVGMITGDGSVNPDAPIIACTAEILANRALRDGRDADADVVVIDEFHYYAEPQRGWAWQVPLLELPQTQFILMSATLGTTERFEEGLTELTGRPTALVKTSQRPVPLTFQYRETPLHESIEELLELGRAPIYIVHFTQREATEAAQSLMSINPLSKDEKERIKNLIGNFRFDSPIGKDLRKFLGHGIGVHHAGLLPKYRLLVEKLAQAGLLKLICGTDTLGVGVNVPIRSVLFTQLCKYDGTDTRTLRVREFQQIAGRAGRKGFDDAGDVWAQAPAHIVENKRAEEKAAASAKNKKVVKKKPPERGYSHWSEETFTKLIEGDPEKLTSSFQVNHQMLMNLLDRPADDQGHDGLDAAKRLLTENHETRHRQRRHIRRAISIYRSLIDSGVVERLDVRDDLGRRVRVTVDLQQEFALNQPLSLFAVEAIEALDPEDPEHALNVLSVIEAVQESPRVVIAAQVNKIKGELVAELKSEGMEYEDRMERLDEVEPPQPLAEYLFAAFDIFRAHHPWVEGAPLQPKSVTRDLYERAMTFAEYINHYGLKRSEGVVLRYLSDTYKGLIQNVPEDFKTEDIYDLTEWIGELVRQVDSSLIDEWERLTDPEADAGTSDDELVRQQQARADVMRNKRAFRVMVRNEAFRWVQVLARRRYDEFENGDEIGDAFSTYWELFDEVITDADARGPEHFIFDDATGTVTQVIVDPEGGHEWRAIGHVDVEASREEGRAVVVLDRVEELR